MTNRSAVRRLTRTHFVQVESKTARDTRISYRALGLLTYCLDQSDSWNVRSEQLARGEGREGRDAVRKALHELAAHGYYRLERRRFRDGKTAMGAAVSEYPNDQWAQDYVTFGGKLDIPVIEQEDGSFRIRYPDASLGPDGFTAPAPEPDDVPDEPAPEPEPEPKPKKTPRPTPPAAARSGSQKRRSTPEKQTEGADDQKAAKEKTPAQEVATWYYEHATQHLGPYAGKQKSGWYFGLVKLSQQALDAEYTQKQVAKAFQRTGVHFPTAHQFQRALSDERNNNPMPAQYGGRPAPYSDAATWGTHGTTVPPATQDHDDGATFGIVPA
ncbi:hypothetical protein ACLQ16_04295 [Streptomyces albidoflavus]|uniref:hypothetical protein n=1 Tax=Streptomyces albidoflavus TaxID=1886 RepID=UPI000A1CCCD0|nr:hypothetical protein [Streptomyces albidoflavus]